MEFLESRVKGGESEGGPCSMDVPLFPAPPPVLDECAATSLPGPGPGPGPGPRPRPTPRVPEFAVSYIRKRHVVPRGRGTSGIYWKRRRRLCRNSVHPYSKTKERVTEFRVRMTERCHVDEQQDEQQDDQDVVCAIDTPSTFTEDVSPRFKLESEINAVPSTRSLGIQTTEGIPLRLRVLPSIRDIVEEENIQANSSNRKANSRIWSHLRFVGRLSVSQLGLLWLLAIWAVAGAAAFCAAEGPRERDQVIHLKDMQKDLAVGLAMELRQLRTEQEQDVEPLWSKKVERYVIKHEELLLMAFNSGYGESGNRGQLWTFSGCVLFAISLLTTLGFGAPVPRTTAGRTVAVIFAAIGIPAHFLLIMNFGILLAVRLQRYAIAKRAAKNAQTSNGYYSTSLVPNWVKVLPFVCTVCYYLLGILCFGVARSRPIAASVLFPLDFTAAGGLSTTRGHVRILYGLYLEGAVTIAAVAVAVLQVSATQSLTNIGLKYGLLVEA